MASNTLRHDGAGQTGAADPGLRWGPLLLLVGVAVGLRVLALLLAKTDLYVDEAQYWSWAKVPDFGYYSKPPLIAWIIAVTTALFGNSEWAVRLAAPILHGATSLVLAALAARFYGGRVGFWSAVTFLLVPAVSLSSLLITTDIPLLLAWSFALLFMARWLDDGGWGNALGLGLAIGVGLNAKYAMAFFPAAALLYLLLTPEHRRRLLGPQFWAAIAIGILLIVPNILWNAAHSFVTFSHTRDNANWSGPAIHPEAMAEFLGSQFGVFGPILFAALLAMVFGLRRSANRPADRFLIVFSVPILAAFTLQAIIKEANANWAATAYPAATILVTALLITHSKPDDAKRRMLFRASTGLHGLIAFVLLVAPAFAPSLWLPKIGNPMSRVLGWSDYMSALGKEAQASGARTLIFVRRGDAAEALYYLRDTPFAIAVTPPEPGARPRDHFELTRPFTTALPAPGLVVLPAPRDTSAPVAWPSLDVTTEAEEGRIPVARGVTKSLEIAVRKVTWQTP
ncbi:putative membrane protein [Hartmannibacter diazotrophicus]|uniref:Putative membrane protein n=1 Tax=Hartmannibacter diazotrophicus TaxID=1482074 RepID=A0A2C9D305_9HYPH|nr:glycosyltransferase family 39 protein [Hartmannibacter diazotrophicus]SON54538.1 putative membrane protein [Hartmannibacter diazotrophicus]